jgi:hypothetical protein
VGEAYYQATLNNVNAAFSGQRVSYETTIDFPEAGTRWLMVSYTPDVGESGHVQGIFIAAYDITERKQAEAQLAEQLDELRRWHEATLGREARVLDLKREVNELLAQTGQPPRYLSAED